jgi:hypothetical protein
MQAWVLGFVTGSSAMLDVLQQAGIVVANGTVLTDKKVADTDAQAVAAWMTKHCADHPLDSIYKAAGGLVLELMARANVKRP